MKHISLFSGIGGFDLAATWAGYTNIVSCEINPVARRILQYYWPECYHHDDIHTLNASIIHEKTTEKYGDTWKSDGVIISGGFPCQPYSVAGKRQGKTDNRHLFPQMLRIIHEIKPDWIVGENVLGLVNWQKGMVFNEIESDLEIAGYEVQSYVLPACGLNAPHIRNRIYIIAHRRDSRIENKRQSGENKISKYPTITHSNIERHEKLNNTALSNQQKIWRKFSQYMPEVSFSYWEQFPTQSPVCPRNDGIPSKLDGITVSRWRNESIAGAGNAVVPQIPFQIFQAINEYESLILQ